VSPRAGGDRGNTDPVLDPDFPRISAADLSLPEPPDQTELPVEGEQPEPEQVEAP
jgi:hypothetical protein